MRTPLKTVDRFTVSLPKKLSGEIEQIRLELNIPKSELIKIAVEKYLAIHRKRKLQKAVEIMAKEYEIDSDLTALAVLDSDDFK